jgi:hypothetical protein
MTTQIQFKRGAAADLTTLNPLLASGEPCYEVDTGQFKIGDGETAWNDLAYAGGAGGDPESPATVLPIEPTVSAAISSGTLTLNLDDARIFRVTHDANITTLSITNVPAATNTAVSFTLILTGTSTSHTITWPAAIKWPANVTPVLTNINNKVDIFNFMTVDNGTTWFGFNGGQNF